MSEIILQVDSIDPLALFGEKNIKLNLLRESIPEVSITSRGRNVKIIGEKKFTQKAKSKLELMVRLLNEHKELSVQTVKDILQGDNPFDHKLGNGSSVKTILYARDGKQIKAKTKNQARLVHAAEQNDILFALGPAGTGKTYTAVAMAIRALKNKTVKKIILTRPAVEAGESLGFLPGDLKEKIDPYLRPLYDALDDMIKPDQLIQFMDTRIIEIAPLAYMRGRTLDNAFIILDEAQNCSEAQIKMFLTRLGPTAKCIITGDLSQVDLPRHQRSGLRTTIRLLGKIKGIDAVYLTSDDVVRHRLVKEIIRAYEQQEEHRYQMENKKSNGQLEAPVQVNKDDK